MKFAKSFIFALLMISSSSYAAIKIVNNSSGPFTPELKFISASGAIYQCNQIPLLKNQGEAVTIPSECFNWGDETAYLSQFIGVQPGEPDQKAYCPEFEPPLGENEDITIIFQGINPEKSPPANGVCQVKHSA